MRYLTAATLAMAIAATFSGEAAAQTYPWCANYGVDSSKNCGFVSRLQCLDTIRGMGGHCEENPLYTGRPLEEDAHPAAARAQPSKKPRG